MKLLEKELGSAAVFIGIRSENWRVTYPGRDNIMQKGLTTICQPPQAETRFRTVA